MRTIVLFLLIAVGCFSCVNSREEKEHNEAYEALQFLGAVAAYPNTDIPADGYGKAWDFMSENYWSVAARGGATWQSLGPTNIGGRTISIAFHPVDTNVIFLGSASGGLWKTITGGYGANAWQPVETGHDIHGVSAIAFNPSDPNEIWIGTGETYDYGKTLHGLDIRTTRGSHGIGILRSTNGGANWAQVLDWSYQNQRTVWDIIFHPTNPQIVYAATTEGVLKTTNSGGFWETSLNEKMVMDLAIDTQDPNVLYAGVGNLTSANKGVYQTKDGGQAWNRLTNGLPANNHSGRTSVTVYPNDPNIVYAQINNDFSTVGLYKTVNKGANWSLISSTDLASYQGWYAKCLHVTPGNPNEVWAGGTYLWKTTNGQVFTQQTDYVPSQIKTEPWPDMHDLVANPKDPKKLYLLTDAGLYRSNDNGFNWLWCADGYNVSQFYTGSVSHQDPELVIGGLQDRNTQLHTGQNLWTPIGGGDGTFNAIDPLDDTQLYVASQNLYLNSSQNGNIFQGQGSAFVAPFMLAPSNPNVIYAGDRYLNVSSNQGITWSASNEVDAGNPILSMDVSRQNSEKVYFATVPRIQPGKMFLTTDGGQSIQMIQQGLPNRYPRDIAVDPVDDNTAYVVYGGFGTHHVYKTTNSGITWQALGGSLPDVPFHTALVNPENEHQVWVGSDLGVFESNDGGSQWAYLGAGMPQAVFVYELEYSPADQSLLAFTHGRGVFRLPIGNPSSTHVVPEQKAIVSPTVFSDQLHIRFEQSLNSVARIKLADAQGRITLQTSLNAGSQEYTFQLPPYLLPGTYFLQVTAGKTRFTKVVVKQ